MNRKVMKMDAEEQGYNDAMLSAQASGADVMQDAIETLIKLKCEEVLRTVHHIDVGGQQIYSVIDADVFKRVFEGWV